MVLNHSYDPGYSPHFRILDLNTSSKSPLPGRPHIAALGLTSWESWGAIIPPTVVAPPVGQLAWSPPDLKWKPVGLHKGCSNRCNAHF